MSALEHSANGLVVFERDGQTVRAQARDGEPWFVLADLCKALGLQNVKDVKDRLDPDGVDQIYLIDSLGRRQLTTVVSEAAMYEVVIRSDKPGAVAFRRWITKEVLPAIRKTGAYLSERAADPFAVMRMMLDQIEANRNDTARALELGQTAEARLDAMEGRHNWFSALAWAKLNGVPTDEESLRQLGHRATIIAREHGHAPSKVQHAHYGLVNSYPEFVWRLAAAYRRTHR